MSNSQQINTMRYPDFFIIGAPKCGTTALYTYLRDHPAIFMPKFKEPHYYCYDFPKIRHVKNTKGYARLFEKAPPESVTGEASVWYLFSDVAAKRILSDAPKAKFIVMLRNPVDMFPSIHSQLLLTLQEDVEDLKTAWALQSERRKSLHLPNYCPEPSLLQYKDVCLLGHQLKKLFKVVNKNQVKIIFFDEFITNTRVIYNSVLDFLHLPDNYPQEFSQKNERRVFKHPHLINFLQHPPPVINSGMFLGKRILNAFGVHPSKYLRQHLMCPGHRPPPDPELRAELIDVFHEDIELIEELQGVDLSHWKR